MESENTGGENSFPSGPRGVVANFPALSAAVSIGGFVGCRRGPAPVWVKEGGRFALPSLVQRTKRTYIFFDRVALWRCGGEVETGRETEGRLDSFLRRVTSNGGLGVRHRWLSLSARRQCGKFEGGGVKAWGDRVFSSTPQGVSETLGAKATARYHNFRDVV